MRMDLHALARAQPTVQPRRAAVDPHRSHLGMRHPERFDHMLDAGVRCAAYLEDAATPRRGDEGRKRAMEAEGDEAGSGEGAGAASDMGKAFPRSITDAA